MDNILTHALLLSRRVRDAEAGLCDPARLLGPLAAFTGATLGAAGEGPGGVPWYDPDAWSWWCWGHRLRKAVNDWVRSGRVLDRREWRDLKRRARPLFAAARECTEAIA
jgi:hypothetical protein